MSLTGLPFDDIRQLMAKLPERDERAIVLTQNRNLNLARRFGQLGDQAKNMEWLAGWSGKSPAVLRPMIALFAGTHGVANKIEAQFGEATLDSVTRLAAGGSPVNQICAANDIGLKVFDLALQYPVDDVTQNDAMDEKGCAATIGFGMEAIAGGIDLLGIAGFGQGSQIANAAILNLISGNDRDWVSLVSSNDTALVGQAVDKHRAVAGNPLEVLRRLGGREHSAIAGAILAARTSHIPVILDGLTARAVAAILEDELPGACGHCMFATGSDEFPDNVGPGGILQDAGELFDASAAGLAIGLLKSSAALHANTVIDAD